MKNKLLSVFIFLGSYTVYSQVGIGTPLPNSSSQLEVVASDKGVLIPRINLTGSTDAVTIKNGNINSLLVFNTASVSDVKPGYYYWYNNKWNRIVISSETNSIPGTVTYNPTTNVFSYIDNTGVSQVIDIGAIVKSKETVTTLVGNPNGSYTYTNEAGTAVNIDIVGDVTTNFSTIVNNPTVTNIIEQIVDKTKGIVVFNSTTNQFSYIDNDGNPQLVDISTIVKANETVTTLVNNGGGSYTYNNESGTAVNIDVVGDVTTNFTTIANDPAVTNIIQNIVNKTAGDVIFDSTTNQFSYIDNAGNPQLVDISTIVKANETVTTLVNNGGGSYTYNNESGTAVNIDVVGDVTTNFTTIANDPAVTNIIQNIVNKTAGDVIFDSTTNQFSYIDNDGNPQLVDISTIVKANETVTTLAQNAATGAITYNNETGIATIVQVKSTDTGNILQVGTDGGSLLTPATISSATTVSNASSVNTATVTVNGITSAGAPIVNSNEVTLSGSSLTTTVNGVASTPLDLSPAIAAGQVTTNLAQDPASGLITYTNENAVDQTAVVTSTDAGNILGVGTDGGSLLTPAAITSATTVSNASSVNTATVTVNGVTSAGAPIVNSNTTSLAGSSLTTTVNGVASTPLDLAPAITSATTVSNASSVNTATVTVNGVTSAGALIVNSNATSLSGSSLITTVNGVASTPLDLSPAIAAGQVTTNLAQDPASGLITYTNENAVDQTAVVTSTDVGNILGVGTDGGSLLTPAAITGATTVSNASSVNTATITVNGVTSAGAPIVNSNTLALSGANLTSTINGVPSTALDLTPAIAAATTNTLTATDGSLISTVNGVATTPAVSVLISADNGLTTINGNVQLGGELLNPTILLTDPSFGKTLAIQGLQNSSPFNDVVVIDPFTGVLQKTTAKELNFLNWSIEGNMGIQSSFHFLGTIDDADLIFKRNSIIAGRLEVNNTSFGVNALTDSSGGINNVAIGTLALNSNTTGQRNNALGFSAMTTNTTGSENTGAGYFALNSNTIGGQNTAFGNYALQGNITGNRNTAVGYSSGATLMSGENITLIGAFAGSAAGLSYATAIGSGAFVATSNSLVLGGLNTNVGIGTDSPTNTLHIVPVPAIGIDPLRVEGLQTGGNTDNIVVADATGIFKTITASSLIPDITVSNTSTLNNLNTIVNGVTGTGVSIINSNTTSLTGTSLITTVNGISSTALDLTPAIKASETLTVVAPVVVTGNTIANYTNEAGGTPVEIKETVTSLEDVVTQGTDQYGQLIDVHTLTFTDETNTPNPINMSVLVKGVETLTSLTYDGAAQSLIYNDEDGNASEFKLIDLIGPAQTLTKLEINATTGNLDYTDENQQLSSLDLSQAVKEPWFSTTTNIGATLNTENIYTNGWVGIGYTTPSAIPNEKLRVNGGISTVNNYYADYVFEDYFKGTSTIKSDYKFKRLPEIEDYIKKHKHLPGITPINELEKTKEGYAFNMSELSIQLLEKTEEIYLHIIEQNKAIEAKDKEIQELKEASKQMNLRLEKLEKLIAEQNK